MRHSVQGHVRAEDRGFPQFAIYRVLPALALSLLTQTAFPQVPSPHIDRLDPGHASPGEVITINVYGANFNPEMRLQIDGCKVNSQFETPGLLRAKVAIPATTQPGYKRVTLWPYHVFGRFEIVRPNALEPTAVPQAPIFPPENPHQPAPGQPPFTPEPTVVRRYPERASDLKVSLERAEPRNGRLIISALVQNVGNAPSRNAILRAEADTWGKRGTWWQGGEKVPPIKPGQSRTFHFQPPIPADQYGKKTHLVLQVGASQFVKDIAIPPLCVLCPQWLYILAGCAAIAVAVVRIRYVRRRKRRKKWQKNANDKKPQLPCRAYESYCQKQRVERKAKVTLPLYRVDDVLIIPREPESEHEGSKVLVEEETVDQLNQAIAARRLGEGVDKIRERVAPIAHMILHTISEALNAKTSSKDVAIVARLTGRKVEFEFTLYRCKKKGAVNVWEEEDSWKASIEDERDAPIATLHGLSTTDVGSSDHSFELTEQLVEFIREPETHG